MRIGELARGLGIRTSAIRYYESVGLLRKPPRTSGQRLYADADGVRLRMILSATDAGFTLAEIKRLLPLLEAGHAGRARWSTLAATKLEELSARIRSLEVMQSRLRIALACSCDGDLERCVLATLPRGSRGAQARRRRSV
jgi:MerR family redox-sensitive transcriptional activator SoxR